MTSLVTKNFRLYNSEQLYNKITTGNTDLLYLMIGKTTTWSNDSIPPIVNSSYDSISIEPWKAGIAMKKIVGSDVTYSIPRVDWTSGTVYNSYKSFSDYSTNFYVLTDEYNVYKCMDNNNDVVSTVKPTGTSTAIVTLADGYKWKFMLTIRAVDALKYLTPSYIPVKKLISNDGSDQWTVQTAAVPGTIDTYSVLTGGTDYISHSATAVAGSPTTITLSSGASGVDNTYTNMSVYIVSGTGAGQIRTITGYVGSSKIATVATWSTTPDATSVYTVSPAVVIDGDGSSATAYTTVSGGVITKINPINFGTNYRYADISFNAPVGSGATAKANISPILGHGADCIKELFAHNLTLNVKLTGNESSTFPVSNDYRTVSLVNGPKLTNTSYTSSLNYDLTNKLTLTSITGTFLNDELVTGSVSNAKGYIVSIAGNILSINNTSGLFSDDDVVTGATSAATGSFSTYTQTTVEKYSGDVVFINYTTPTFRSSTQTEDYKITINF